MITAFLTDSTLCIGCKACEVACKEWNDVPADGFNFTGASYDNTAGLGHSTWRHVKFIERAIDVAGDEAAATEVVGEAHLVDHASVDRQWTDARGHERARLDLAARGGDRQQVAVPRVDLGGQLRRDFGEQGRLQFGQVREGA